MEARNHFRAFDHVLDTWDRSLSSDYLCAMHRILKSGTTDAANPVMSAGEFKKFSNVIGDAASDVEAASPEDVPRLVGDLIDSYESKSVRRFEDIVRFHWELERIHPFSDGNGRVGRLLLFKECLRLGIAPFIITKDIRLYYILGLREYANVMDYLEDACGFVQDRFEAAYTPMTKEFMRALHDSGSS